VTSQKVTDLMLGKLLVFLLVLANSEEELPFADEPELPFEPAEPEGFLESDGSDDNEEQPEEGNGADASPTPTPEPVRRTLLEVTGLIEVCAIGGFVLYAVVFFVGRSIINSKVQSTCAAILTSLRRHFAVVQNRVTRRNYHTHDAWITGRTGYQGSLLTFRFKRTCDPLGIVYSIFKGESDTVSFEVLLNPERDWNALFHVSREKPYFVDDLKLKSSNMAQKLVVWSDMGESKQRFVQMVNEFLESRPGCLDLIEISDTNRFETKKDNSYVAKFDFKLKAAVDSDAADQIVDFIVTMCDQFATLALPSDVQLKNGRVREKLRKDRENEGKKEEQKKMTPEEEERLRRKQEKKEQRRMAPRVKMVKQ
jgi:hypothetical protein